MVSVMMELNNLISRQEMLCEQLVIHVRQNSNAVEADIERMYLLAPLEELANLKAKRQRREDEIAFEQAA